VSRHELIGIGALSSTIFVKVPCLNDTIVQG